MNILMLTNTYAPHVGGVARSVEAFGREYRRRGHRVVIVAPQFPGAEADEPDVIRVPAIQNFNGSDFSVRLPIPGLVTASLADFHPDLVHSHHPFLLGDTALRIAALRNVPLVFTHHTMYERYTHYVPGDSPAMARFAMLLATGYANLCDRVFAPSQSVAAVLRERGVLVPIDVVPTGVQTRLFAEGDGSALRRRLGIGPETFVIGHVGRLAPEKNLGFLAQAVARLLKQQPAMHFLVVGAGPSEEQIRAVFRRWRLADRLHLAGPQSGQSLVDAYHAMDVFAFASQTETQGMVLTEAMAAGVPVVAVDAPGAREVVVDGHNGRLLPSENVRQFAAALEWVARLAPHHRQLLCDQARQTAEAFSMPACAAKALEAYAAALRTEVRQKTTEHSVWESALRWIEGEWELWSNVARAATGAIRQRWLWRVTGLHRLRRGWQGLRRAISRSEWSIRLLGLTTSEGTAVEPGRVLAQIDGLAGSQFQRARARGRLPFLRRLIAREGYQVRTLYSGLPSSTPGVQGELFYGVPRAVPTFSFRDAQSGHVVRMYEADAAARVQARLANQGRGLLEGGSAYVDVFTGGAAEAHFCAAASGWGDLLRNANPLVLLPFVVFHLWSILRTAGLMVLEFGLAIVDFLRGVTSGREFRAELKFIASRVTVSIWLREMVTLGATLDAARGLPAIHVNFLGYDEHAHRRGPSSAFAHWTLKGIDRCIWRIWRAARNSRRRDYQVWIYSDHGQEYTVSYIHEHGRPVQEAIAEVFQKAVADLAEAKRRTRAGIAGQRSAWRGGRLTQQVLRRPEVEATLAQADQVAVAAMGPVGHIYPPQPLEPADRLELARRLVHEAKIPMVVTADGGGLWAFTAEGRWALPQDTAQIVGADHPFHEPLREDLAALCRHPDAGQLVFFGWRPHRPMSFPLESGAHAGFGTEETGAFALLPPGSLMPATGRAWLRPAELRAAALHVLGRAPLAAPCRLARTTAAPDVLRLVTYNVHGCVGRDGRISPTRIARLIAQYDPDVVALQELDLRQSHDGHDDQLQAIARELGMQSHAFPPAASEGSHLAEAVLSRHPMRLVRAGALPSLGSLEMPHAVWVEIEFHGRRLQLVNTRLSASRRKRPAELEVLLGPDWLGQADRHEPLVLCGVPGASRRSRAHRLLSQQLADVHARTETGAARSWLGRYRRRRLPRLFVGRQVRTVRGQVARCELARRASKHWPLVVDLRIG